MNGGGRSVQILCVSEKKKLGKHSKLCIKKVCNQQKCSSRIKNRRIYSTVKSSLSVFYHHTVSDVYGLVLKLY